MFFEKIKKELVDIFLKNELNSAEDQSALNVALYQLFSLPGFGGAYAHLKLHQQGPDFLVLSNLNHLDELEDANPLNDVYPSDNYAWEYMSEKEIQALQKELSVLPRYPEVFASWRNPGYSPDSIFNGVISPSVLDKAQNLLEELAQKNEKVLEVLASETCLPELENFSFQWLSCSEMRNYLKEYYRESSFTRKHLKGAGIEYFELNESIEDKTRLYLLVSNSLGPVGVSCLSITHSLKQAYLAYLSVAPGFRQKGLGGEMFFKCFEMAQQKECCLLRSSPGAFTMKNAEITQGFSNKIKGQDWPVLCERDDFRLDVFNHLFKESSNIAQWKDVFLKYAPNNAPKLSYEDAVKLRSELSREIYEVKKSFTTKPRLK